MAWSGQLQPLGYDGRGHEIIRSQLGREAGPLAAHIRTRSSARSSTMRARVGASGEPRDPFGVRRRRARIEAIGQPHPLGGEEAPQAAGPCRLAIERLSQRPRDPGPPPPEPASSARDPPSPRPPASPRPRSRPEPNRPTSRAARRRRPCRSMLSAVRRDLIQVSESAGIAGLGQGQADGGLGGPGGSSRDRIDRPQAVPRLRRSLGRAGGQPRDRMGDQIATLGVRLGEGCGIRSPGRVPVQRQPQVEVGGVGRGQVAPDIRRQLGPVGTQDQGDALPAQRRRQPARGGPGIEDRAAGGGPGLGLQPQRLQVRQGLRPPPRLQQRPAVEALALVGPVRAIGPRRSRPSAPRWPGA